MSKLKNNLKYPIYLFIVILVSKVGYIVVESFYNYYVLTITTSADLSQKTMEALNENGHRISAIGITLLVVPLLYHIFKRFNINIVVSLIISSFITYFIAYEGLNIAVDKIVQINKDKRYDAYYVNIFKYGILNNIFSYDSFINNDKITTNTLDVKDRILLTNSFLLLYADKDLIEKLKQRGKEKVADLYIQRDAKEDYEKQFDIFKKSSQDISKLWNKLNNSKKQIKDNLEKLDDNHIKTSYNKFINSLKQNYTKYKKINSKIKEETSDHKINQAYYDLKKYFRYQRYTKAQREYKTNMINKFGHYIEPSIWLDSDNKLTKNHIKYIITSEIKNKLKDKLGNLPFGLSVKEFMYNDETKLTVMKQLKKNDILIPYEFDYSYKQFRKYFKVMASKKINKAYKSFYFKLNEELGKNDIKLNMNYKQFIYSDYIKNKIKQKIPNEDIDNMLKALYSKDLANFKKIIYLPKVVDKVNEMMYKKEDFKDGAIVSKKGDEAIKLLYIPPFALSVSIIAILLNIITVFSMLLSITSLNNKVINSLKIGLILFIILLPSFSSYDGFDNKMIKKVSNTELKTYISFLNWISYYETKNAEFHNNF